jgi:hypothetical protein
MIKPAALGRRFRLLSRCHMSACVWHHDYQRIRRAIPAREE